MLFPTSINTSSSSSSKSSSVQLLIVLAWTVGFFLLLLANPVAAGLSCQGNEYENAVGNCPDYGAQKLSAGGNVSIVVKYGINMKNLDFTGG